MKNTGGGEFAPIIAAHAGSRGGNSRRTPLLSATPSVAPGGREKLRRTGVGIYPRQGPMPRDFCPKMRVRHGFTELPSPPPATARSNAVVRSRVAAVVSVGASCRHVDEGEKDESFGSPLSFVAGGLDGEEKEDGSGMVAYGELLLAETDAKTNGEGEDRILRCCNRISIYIARSICGRISKNGLGQDYKW
nr:hypothetical protein Iba_chr02eCG8170 [Ipomoea batatas]